MSNQTFISIGPYRDVVHRHRVSFYSTLVTGLALTALALVWIPKKYTSSVLLEVWHADFSPIRSEPSGKMHPTILIWNRVLRRSAKKLSRTRIWQS